MKKLISAHYSYLRQHVPHWLYVQLVVSGFSFLILVCQGIPFCLLGFIGNFIFNPVLALFLCLSTVVFFTELLCIPNTYIIYPLDLVSRSWLYVLSLTSDPALQIPCAQPPALTLATLTFGLLAIMLAKISYAGKNILIIALFCCAFFLAGKKIPDHATDNLPCAQEAIPIIRHAGKTIIVDPGCLGRYVSATSYVQYTLLPHLIQQYGTHTIDHVILLKPGKLTFDAIRALLQRARIKHLYIPFWKGSLSKSGLYTYMRLKEEAQLSGTRLHRLGDTSLVMLHDAYGTVELKNLNKELQKGPIRFTAFCVCHTVDKESVTFYPSNYNFASV